MSLLVLSQLSINHDERLLGNYLKKRKLDLKSSSSKAQG